MLVLQLWHSLLIFQKCFGKSRKKHLYIFSVIFKNCFFFFFFYNRCIICGLKKNQSIGGRNQMVPFYYGGMGHLHLVAYFLSKWTIKSNIISYPPKKIFFKNWLPNSVAEIGKSVNYESVSQEFESCCAFYNFYLSKHF